MTIILSIIYSFKAIYTTRQASQYFLTIWVSQFVFGYSMYWISMYMIFDDEQFHHYMNVSGFKLMIFIITSHIIGILIVFISVIRMIYKMEHGDYQQDTYLDKKRSEMEEAIEDNTIEQYMIRVAATLIGSVAALIGWLGVNDVETLTIATIGTSYFLLCGLYYQSKSLYGTVFDGLIVLILMKTILTIRNKRMSPTIHDLHDELYGNSICLFH